MSTLSLFAPAPAATAPPVTPHVGVLSLVAEPFVPCGWRVVFAQHVGSGCYQVLASAVLSGRTRHLALVHAREVAARLTAYQQQYGIYHHPHPLPSLVPFIPSGFL